MTGVRTTSQTFGSEPTPRTSSRRVPLGRGRGFKRTVLTLTAVVLALLLLAPLTCSVVSVSPESLIYPASILFIALFVAQLWSWYYVAGSLFDPYSIFAIAAMLFNGSRAVLEVFGMNHDGVFGLQFSAQTTLTTIFLVTLGLWSYHLGGIICVSRSRRSPLERGGPQNPGHLRLLGWLLIAIAAFPSYILMQEAIKVVMSNGYFALYQAEKLTSLRATPLVLATLLVPGVLMVTAAGRGRRCQLGATFVLVGLYALTQLFLGSRALAAACIVPYIWVWHRCVRRVPKNAIALSGFLLVVVLFPLVRITRSFVGEDRLSPRTLVEAFYSIDNPLVASVSEMGGSASTIAYTVDLVPDSRPFDYGASYGLGILTLIPNLFWDVHPSIARGTPASWLIATVDPTTAARGGGLGYSFIAEAYLNAGWVGVVIVCGALGFAFARLARSGARALDVAKIACTATIMAFTLKYVRSDCTEIVRGVVWFALAPYALAKAMARKPRDTAQIRNISLPRPECHTSVDTAVTARHRHLLVTP